MKIKTLLRVISTVTCQDIYLHIYSIYSGHLSDIYSDIDIYAGKLSDIYLGIISDILFGI